MAATSSAPPPRSPPAGPGRHLVVDTSQQGEAAEGADRGEARPHQRPEAGTVGGVRQRHEEQAEPEARSEGEEHTPSVRRPDRVAALRRHEHDGAEGEGHAHAVGHRRPVALHQARRHGHGGRQQTGDGGDDAHRSDGEGPVEEDDADHAGQTADPADDEVVAPELAVHERQAGHHEGQADDVGPEHHRGGPGAPRGHPSAEVAHAVDDRGQEGEDRGHRTILGDRAGACGRGYGAATREPGGVRMPEARNGDVVLHYDTFGSSADPTLLFVNGLGSQCINFPEPWCEKFAAAGYQVVRFDNRDVGLSLEARRHPVRAGGHGRRTPSRCSTPSARARAHVMGLSMGGMIVQRLAIDHADRLLTMTSVMSRTGEDGYGGSAPEALAFLLAPPPTEREAYIDNHVAAIAVYGSQPEWIDEADTRARAAAAYDRCFCPDGIGRQMRAVMADPPRTDALRAVSVPTLVIHGSRDNLIDPSGGRRTAEVIPGARYVEIEGMGHDYPPAVWDQWVGIWSDFAASAVSRRGLPL